MFYDILDKKRIAILPLLASFKHEFYLAGGTALALQFGHRDSIDFDFFKKADFLTDELFCRVKDVFFEHKILKIQEEKNTLTVLIDDDIRLSFFSYNYDLVTDLMIEENLSLASVEDIACMKMSAILSRATNKDYIDLYYILQDNTLSHLLILCNKKFPDIDTNLILKSLVYFEDVIIDPIVFKHSKDIDFKTVKDFFIALLEANLN